MRILLADDDTVSCQLLEKTLAGWGYEVLTVSSGDGAWQVLQQPDAPRLAILDWMLPGLSGPSLCWAIRSKPQAHYVYLLIITGKGEAGDVVAGLDAGADDFLTKPVNLAEL